MIINRISIPEPFNFAASTNGALIVWQQKININ
jgi:hypothetical protein